MTDAQGVNPPAKEAAREEAKRRRELVRQLIQLPQEEIEGALRLVGMEEGSAEWEAAMDAWRSAQKRR